MEQLQNDIFDVIFPYLPMKKSSYHCEVYKQDKMILVTDYYNTMYARGITKQALIAENYLMCNFALQDVGQFIRNLFPRYHQFSLEIDDCSKIIPILLGSESYTFLPADTARPFLETGKLRVIPLLVLETPIINSYLICKNSKQELCQSIFMWFHVTTRQRASFIGEFSPFRYFLPNLLASQKLPVGEFCAISHFLPNPHCLISSFYGRIDKLQTK